MKTLPAKSTVLFELGYPQKDVRPARTNNNRRKNTGKASRVVIDLLFFGCMILLGSCAWIQTHQPQLVAVSEVALSHIAKDAYAIGISALQNEITTGFSEDLGYAMQTSTREMLPSLVSSENLADYLNAWNMDNTNALAKLVPKGLDAPSAQKVALVIVDSQAAAIPAAKPREGEAPSELPLLSSK
jgi:hypothetical protein